MSEGAPQEQSSTGADGAGPASEAAPRFTPGPVSDRVLEGLDRAAEEVGGPYEPLPAIEGAVAFTHFDTPSSDAGSVVVLAARENLDQLPLQSLVRIKSLTDSNELDRTFLGVVVAGPFAEPDGLRADSPIVIATTIRGRIFLPRYHGRAQVQILGEEVGDQLMPPRYRPRPNSPVFPLSLDETREVLKVHGDICLGTIVGQEEIEVRFPSDKKSVLPRHLAVLGTTGAGKSTTTSGIIHQLRASGVATILFDVEGEYTEIDRPTEDKVMLKALEARGKTPAPTEPLCLYHLVGRETSREIPGGHTREFSLRLAELSPHAIAEILELNDPQTERFLLAYDATKRILRELKIYPRTPAEEKAALDFDELEEGWREVTMSRLIDVVDAIVHVAGKSEGDPEPFNAEFKSGHGLAAVKRQADLAAKASSHAASWRVVRSRLWSIHRFRVFDNPAGEPLDYDLLVRADRVSVVDLSDTDSPQLNNLVIASVLRGVQLAQERAVQKAHEAQATPPAVEVVIEEAHEFLSRERIKQMPTLFQQVARIAKRGRKRWLGLIFVTQLPQHLPDEVIGLVNNFVIHKIGDSNVVDRLRRVIPGLDRSQWEMVPGLAPGQAIVSLTSLARPLLVAVDPTPSRLRLID
jgi:uncharacterized protein